MKLSCGARPQQAGTWLAGVILACAFVSHGSAATPAVVGVLAPEGEEKARADWQATTRHLQAALPGVALQWRYFGLQELGAAVSEAGVDFVVTNSGHAVELEDAFGVHPLATVHRPALRSPSEAVSSAVVVRVDRKDLRSLQDLRGAHLLAVAPNAFGGWQAVRRELRARGISEAALGSLAFAGFPMQDILRRIAAGEADAGVVRACLLEEMIARGESKLENLRVLDERPDDRIGCKRSTRLYPDWPFAAAGHTPHDLSRRVAAALLTMPRAPGDPGWTAPADYQPVRQMFRELRFAAFAGMETTLLDLAERYWEWLLAGALAMVAWILYMVQIEHLVHVRTRELRQAIAARHALEQGLQVNKEQAEHMARLSILGELSTTLAHEINQPLAAVGNYANSLLRRLDADRLTSEAVRDASAEIARQSERAAAVVRRIRAFARKRAMVREPMLPETVAREAIELFRGLQTSAPAVELRNELEGSPVLEGDPLQVQQVLLNLLKNGDDASHGEVSCPALVVTLRRNAAEVQFCVRDFGHGLAASARDRLFEPFFTTKAEGLGLGLSICRTIAEEHGGWLTAEAPKSGPGTVFKLSLPVARLTAFRAEGST